MMIVAIDLTDFNKDFTHWWESYNDEHDNDVKGMEQAFLAGMQVERKACLAIYVNGFENNWVVQDVIDAIKARRNDK